MPSIVTHALVGVAGGRISTARRMPARFWAALAVLSVLPDADVIGFRLGVRYGDFLGHRGFFHSIPFGLALGFATALALFPGRRLRVGVLFALVAASHGILDAATDGGLGVALLSPFSRARIFLPFRPLRVSPIGVRAFFGPWGLSVLASEVVWIWCPLAVALAAARFARRRPPPARRPTGAPPRAASSPRG